MASGDALAVMGQTGNAAGGYDHCHFEVRATANGKGLAPTAYAGCPNAVGVYGAADTPRQTLTIGPVSQRDADALLALCRQRGLVKAGLYKSEWS